MNRRSSRLTSQPSINLEKLLIVRNDRAGWTDKTLDPGCRPRRRERKAQVRTFNCPRQLSLVSLPACQRSRPAAPATEPGVSLCLEEPAE
jgi:hypothetical protein